MIGTAEIPWGSRFAVDTADPVYFMGEVVMKIPGKCIFFKANNQMDPWVLLEYIRIRMLDVNKMTFNFKFFG